MSAPASRPPAQTAAPEPSSTVWREHYATGVRGARWWPCEELVRAVSRRQQRAPLGDVVEVGCGNGANLWFLAEVADRVTGIDLDAGALEMARRHMRRRGVEASLGHCDLRDGLPFPDASVDAVVDVMTSQHVPWGAHAGLLAEYRRVLRSGGWLFLYHLGAGTTTRGSRMVGDPFTWDRLPALFPEAGLVSLPPAWALREALTGAGFSVVDARQQMRLYPGGDPVAVYQVMEGEAV
jgi:SAM-dependent methyltransferase